MRKVNISLSVYTLHRRAMQKLVKMLAFALAMLLCCFDELLHAKPVSFDVPTNPVFYKRFHRRRPSPHYPELEVYEVREVYFVRRTTPKPKEVTRLSDEEMDQRIRCDFEPMLPQCAKLSTERSSTTKSTISTTTTEAATTTSTTSTTTTDLPFLPELPQQADDFPDSSTNLTDTVASTEDDEFPLEDDTEDLDADDYDSSTNEPLDDDPEPDDYNSGGSIGGNDPSK